MGDSTDGSRVIGDMVRALFVAATALLALLLVAFAVAAAVQLIGRPSDPDVPDTVMPIIGVEDLVLVGLMAAVAVTGFLGTVRLWLEASWHVATWAVATYAAMIPFLAIGLVMNGLGQH